MINNTFVTNQPSFIDSYLSEIIINEIHVYDITSDSRVLSIVESSLNLSNCTATDLYGSSSGIFISMSFETQASLGNITYTNSTMKFASVLSSSLDMSIVQMNNVTLSNRLIE